MASKRKITLKYLLDKGYKYAIAIGFLAGITVFSNGGSLNKIKDYKENVKFFPKTGYVQTVEDGDTFTLKGGIIVRLIGVDTPDRGQKGYTEAGVFLADNVSSKKVYLEYDRYQDDIYSRVLAWVWIDCENTPQFVPADYMYKSQSESSVGLTENPKGCKKGKLINEELVKSGFAKTVKYQDRGPLKYEERLLSY